MKAVKSPINNAIKRMKPVLTHVGEGFIILEVFLCVFVLK